MRTTIIPVGMLQTNCYVVEDDHKNAIIVDPGAKPERIIEYISKEGLTPRFIYLTHAHWDHVGAVDALYREYKLPIYMHEDDYELINNPSSNFRIDHKIHVASPVTFLEEGKHVLHGFEVELIHAPGHTEGCMMMIYRGQLFSGDVLFHEDIGRTDLATSNPSKMRNTLRVIKTLDPDLIVYPGHEESSVLSHEFMYNPHLR